MPTMQGMEMNDAGMSMNMDPVSIQQDRNASCCELSAPKAQPVSTARVPDYGNATFAAISNSSFLDIRPLFIGPQAAGSLSRRSGPSLQVVLCVFLI